MNLIPKIEGGARKKKRRSACVYLTKKQCRFPCQPVGNKCRTMFSKKKWKENKKIKADSKKKKKRKNRSEEESPLQPVNTPEPNEEYVPTIKDTIPESEDSSTVSEEPTPVEEVAAEPAAPEKQEDVDTGAMPESAVEEGSKPEPEPAVESTTPEPEPAVEGTTPEPEPAVEGTTPESKPESEPMVEGNEKKAPSFLDGVSAALGLDKKGGSRKNKRRKSTTLKKKSKRKKTSTRKKRSTRKKS